MNRPPAVANQFYPGNPERLQQTVANLISASKRSALSPKALIAPHAGYMYSGPIAASAYTHLYNIAEPIKTGVLIGPSHRVRLEGLAASRAVCFETPLGDVRVNQEENARLMNRFEWVHYNDNAHALEHGLEVQLPFLQTMLDDFTIVPLVCGDSLPEQVSTVLNILGEDRKTFIVISSDLSHFHDYSTACFVDKVTTEAIETYTWEAINGKMACGHIAIRGCLQFAKKHHLRVYTVAQCNSGDTQGNKQKVVGYGAYLFTLDETNDEA